MLPFAFNAFATLIALVVAAFVGGIGRRWFRRIPSLEAFSPSERRILTYQLSAISLSGIAGLGVFLFSVWSSTAFEVLTAYPASLLLALPSLALFAFVAVTSIARRVTILTVFRIGREPAKGSPALAYGMILLALIAYGTWNVMFSTP
jgi:hypothetical protein